jgi:hypothetical protein
MSWRQTSRFEALRASRKCVDPSQLRDQAARSVTKPLGEGPATASGVCFALIAAIISAAGWHEAAMRNPSTNCSMRRRLTTIPCLLRHGWHAWSASYSACCRRSSKQRRGSPVGRSSPQGKIEANVGLCYMDIMIKIIEDESDRGLWSDVAHAVNTAADAAYLLTAALRCKERDEAVAYAADQLDERVQETKDLFNKLFRARSGRRSFPPKDDRKMKAVG